MPHKIRAAFLIQPKVSIINTHNSLISGRHAFLVRWLRSFAHPKFKSAVKTKPPLADGQCSHQRATWCPVTYVTPPFLEKLSPLASFLLDVINLKIPTRPLPLAPIGILNNANSTAFFKLQISLPVSVPNELVRTFPTGSKSSPLAWLLHFHHCLTCNQTFKYVLTSPSGVGHPLLLLRLFYIEQYVLVYACDELHLL